MRIQKSKYWLKEVFRWCKWKLSYSNGSYCEIIQDKIHLTGLYGDSEGKKVVIKSIDGDISSPRELGLKLAKLVLKEYENYEG